MPVRVSTWPRVVLIAIVAGSVPFANAQGLIAPRAVSPPDPPLTLNAIGTPTEGWAVVRYSVLKDGTSASIRVIDIVPPGADPGATIDAVEQWTFTPGTKDGDPIDWINNEAVVVFRSLEEDSAPSAAFQEGYDEILETVQARIPTIDGPDPEAAVQAFEELRDANLTLLRRNATRVEDIALALSQAMFINIYLNDVHLAYDFARRATDRRISLLDEKDLRAALQQRLQLEAALGRTRDALITLDRIDAGYGPDDSNPAAEFAERLSDRARNEEILQTMGYIGDRSWRIEASRGIFTLGDIEGTIDSIDAECDSARIRLDYQDDVDWRLPDSLGACIYFINGEPGTSFSFFELLPPENQPQRQPTILR